MLGGNSKKRSDSINRPVLNPLYRDTWFPTRKWNQSTTTCKACFHPLYRGTWFPTSLLIALTSSARLSFHPLYRGTWFPTRSKSGRPGRCLTCFHPLYRGTWFPTRSLRAVTFMAVGSFHPLYRGTWFPTSRSTLMGTNSVPCFHPLYRGTWFPTYQKNTPSDQRRRKRFTHPRRIDHIPTFASLNHDKNTRSTHYTPNAGIEFSQAGFAPPRVNPVQNHT